MRHCYGYITGTDACAALGFKNMSLVGYKWLFVLALANTSKK
jgi:hypothetical protein